MYMCCIHASAILQGSRIQAGCLGRMKSVSTEPFQQVLAWKVICFLGAQQLGNYGTGKCLRSLQLLSLVSPGID